MNLSRRMFMEFALGVPLSAALDAQAMFAAGKPQGMASASLPPLFPKPNIIRYDADCFTINGQDTILRGAVFHYPRCPRELWRDRLVKLKHVGFNAIQSYVFWNYHEPVEGQVDMSEFEDFVKLVGLFGFWMIVRPGPYVCAEWDAGGFPHWIIGRQFPLRSASPKSIATSQHWYNSVLPVIKRHTITNGGPIILIQIENEYDDWPLPAAEKMRYITALAEMVWKAGIDIPIFTNWCKQARDNSDPVMARIFDTCDFYPHWNIVAGTVPRLEQLRRQEPDSPVSIAELQGGWFSQFGGKLSVNQHGINGAQLNALTKTVLAHGVTYFSYYMGFGGTNFDWAGKTITTTYDYAAPVREPGGLWEKYYDARGICASLANFEKILARAQVAAGASSSNPQVSVTLRANGKSGVLFVRENANAEQSFTMSFPDPASASQRTIYVPREGSLALGPRAMKMLPVQVPIAGGHLRYSTAELLLSSLQGQLSYVVLYDEPGAAVEFALAADSKPEIEGETAYQHWDAAQKSAIIGATLDKDEKVLLVNKRLIVLLVVRERALRTWVNSPPATAGLRSVIPMVSDAALVDDSSALGALDLQFAPGEHAITALLPAKPSGCRVDGQPTSVRYDERWGTAAVHISTPKLPSRPRTLTEAESWVETFELDSGDWFSGSLQPLEKLGQIPYGYVKYVTEFRAGANDGMSISTFDDDGKQVFINGKRVAEASNPDMGEKFALGPYVHEGTNRLEISYELFGSYNGRLQMERLKGIKSVRVLRHLDVPAAINNWKIQRVPAAMRGREIDPEFSLGGWQNATLGGGSPREWMPGFCWTRFSFRLEQPPETWSVAWKVTLESARDALLYLNGRFVGRYVTVGPQTDFYLPEPWLRFGTGSANLLTLVLGYIHSPQAVTRLEISPYKEFATRRTRVEFKWE